jgi:predicted dehydrogenase
MSDRLRVAVAGGGIGREHIAAYRALPDQYELLAICDIDAAKARALAEQHGIPRHTADFDELCGMGDLDVFDICTPPHLHVPQALRALAAGKYAICEKPLASSIRDIDQLIAASAAAGRHVMPIFQYRFGHGLQKLKYLVDQGLAGKAYLATVETAWRRRADYYAVPWRGKWRTELGGTLLSHAIHAHDVLSYIAGPARSVFARTATRVNPIEVEDCAAASLELADGALATLAVTLGSPAEITRHRFSFAELTAESNTRPYTSSGDPWVFTGDSPAAEARIAEALASFEPLPEGFAGQLLRFHRALRDGAALPVTLVDARASIELITAMYVSARSGQAVALPLGPEHPNYAGWLPDADG